MGHIRLGRLPKTKPWIRVIQALETEQHDASAISAATARAAATELEGVQGDETVAACIWVLARIAGASRDDFFPEELLVLGVDPRRASTGLGFVSEIRRAAVESGAAHRSMVGDMALESLSEVLTKRVVNQASSLFGTTSEDIHRAVAGFRTPANFGAVARDFYGSLMSRVLRFVTDKELSNHVAGSPDGSESAPDRARAVNRDIDRYCRESAKIVEEFASGWYSKRNWQTKYDIARQDAAGFSAHALTKLRMEIEGEAE